MFRFLLLLSLAAKAAFGHAPPIPTPQAPYRVQGTTLRDAKGERFLLQGASLHVTGDIPALTFRILRQRWNFNAVRLVIPDAVDLEAVANLIATANTEGLVVILACQTGGDENFWARTAGHLRESPMLVFSIGQREPTPEFTDDADRWPSWRTRTESLIAAIRSTGAEQIIAAGAYRDSQDFRDFPATAFPEDRNLLLEAQPYRSQAATEAQRNASLGDLTARLPVYASEWGLPADTDCAAVTSDPGWVYEFVAYALFKNISWTIPIEQLSPDPATLQPSTLNREPGCGPGQILLLWLTGDAYGFGTILSDLIASAAGGPASPLVPGQVLAIYGQGLGPEFELRAQPDDQGMLPTNLGGVEVRIDGTAVPIVTAESFTLRVQVPYELEGKADAEVQASYRDVPSNPIRMPVVTNAPEIYARPGNPTDADVVLEDGTANGPSRSAAAGSSVTFRVTGAGPLLPAARSGKVAVAPGAKIAAGVAVTIDGQAAEVLETAEVPGLVGVVAIRVRVPSLRLPSPKAASLAVTVGGVRNKANVQMWVQ